MAGAIVQVKQLAQNTAASPASITLDTPATAGNMLVVVYGGDSYVASANRPAGFSEPAGGRQETFLGHYVWYKLAAGGETTFSATSSPTSTWCMIALELSGVAALDVSNGTFLATGANTMDTPTVTPTAGGRFVVATIGASHNANFNPGQGAWTNGFTERADVATSLASGTRDNIAVATLSLTANGVAGVSAGAAWDAEISPQSRTGIILAFQESGTAWSYGYDVTIG